MAGFISERVAGFTLECLAGFVGIRRVGPGERRSWPQGRCVPLAFAASARCRPAWLSELHFPLLAAGSSKLTPGSGTVPLATLRGSGAIVVAWLPELLGKGREAASLSYAAANEPRAVD
jgi:hypothetical protein